MNIDFTDVFISIGLISAVAGWALIEGVIWVYSHIGLVWIA